MSVAATTERNAETIADILKRYNVIISGAMADGVANSKDITMSGKKFVPTEVYRVQLNSHSQITIPKEMRKDLEIGPDNFIYLFVKGNKVLIQKELSWGEFRGQMDKIVEELPEDAKKIMAGQAKSGKTDDELMEEWLESPEGKAYLEENYE